MERMAAVSPDLANSPPLRRSILVIYSLYAIPGRSNRRRLPLQGENDHMSGFNGSRISGVARTVMTGLAVAVGLFSFRLLGVPFGRVFQVDPGIVGVVEAAPVAALAHMLIAPVALVAGAFQFSSAIRARRPALHRWLGRTYVCACLLGGVAGFFTALHASGGPVAGLGFGSLAICWIVATAAGWQAARRRDFASHSMWMSYSYAMTFGAVTLRLQIPLGFALGYQSYSEMSVWLAYTAWLPNLALVAAWRAMKTADVVRIK